MRKGEKRFAGCGDEPSVTEMLNDPIIHLIMQRDGVDEADLVRIIVSAQRSFETRRELNCAA